MPFCPKCRYEYKPTVETCPDCGKRLVAKLNETKRGKAEAEKVKRFIPEVESKLRLLYITKSMIYANFLRETLEKNHIPCLIRSESGYNMRIGALIRHPLTDIKIYVREEDFEKSSMIREQLIDSL